MLKELIVSVNGREKKIAIIENGKVTEFYIERGESDQGIVGNIYKGRVMRVLPGMQSAFVDIGLERDAFLYVSDFFDEEEEFERIVIDKPKDATTRPANNEREQASARAGAREQPPQRLLAPSLEPDEDLDESSSDEFARPAAISNVMVNDKSESASRSNDSSAQTPVAERYRETDRQQQQRRSQQPQRGDRRRGRDERATPATSTTFSAEKPATPESLSVDTLFALGSADSFERISDDESAADDGSMLKDAIMQERILDRIHAVEFEMDVAETSALEANSTFAALSPAASFQRIADDEEESSATPDARNISGVQETVAAHIDAFIDDTIGDSASPNNALRFERISDDESLAENAVKTETSSQPSAAVVNEALAAKNVRRGSSSSSAATKRPRRPAKTIAATDADGRDAATAEATKPITNSSGEASSVDEAPAQTKRGGRAASANRGKADDEKPTRNAGGRRTRARSSNNSGATKRANKTETAANTVTSEAGSTETDAQNMPDAEASIGSPATRGEFATRRGGRRRRRGGSNNGKQSPTGPTETGDEQSAYNAAPGGVSSNGGDAEHVDDEIEQSGDGEVSEQLPAGASIAAAPSTTTTPVPERPPSASNGRSGNRRTDQRGKMRRGGGGGNGERTPQPTITDLLREGQEIIVQIAKEPISQKGARITSHIALPGRFLVYMPTIEHVGVSRKIESDSERVRLRRLIQAIRAEEDVPSGGFIVRTAGVGISEEDLRDDARYLVRTWLDIRRSAEKAKAPALAHRDLDLVQRLLRDQLSDEFTAIRVDSEEEYQRIVEFVNRIQPRLVKRVKLYTREEPILEAYAVQAEIDKAVKPRVWLRSGGYLVINQTEALVAIDVNTGKFVGRGGNRLEDTITKTNLEAVDEIVRQIRLRDLGGIIVLDLIDMEERRNRQRVMQALQEALANDKSPTKVLSFNDFGLVIMTRKRVKQSLERTLCAPCSYCQGAGLVKSPQTVCYELLEEARRLSRGMEGEPTKQVTLRVNPEVARALRTDERDVLIELEDYLGAIDITSDEHIHQEHFDFAFA